MNINERFNELQTLDMERPGTWPRWIQIMMSVLLAVVIIGVGVYALILPDYDELDVQQKKELDLKSEFERKQRKVAALDAYKAQLAEMEHSFGDMLKQLPSRTEVANLLNDISQTRVASSLEEELFQPLPELPKEFYAELPNKIIVTGDYHQMGAFIAGVAALPRIVTIDEVDLRPVSAQGPGAKQAAIVPGQLRLTAQAKTYRYLDDTEQAELRTKKK